MNEWELIQKFQKYFNASEIDENHRCEQERFMGPFDPLIIHIEENAVGCVDLRKQRGTIPGFVELAYIFVYKQKSGFGSVILRKLSDLADCYNLEIVLDAVPISKIKDPIPQWKLHEFYQSFGFKIEIEGSNNMTRLPNA